MTWIAPNNLTLAIITGSICGMGLNPFPSFDVSVFSPFLAWTVMPPCISGHVKADSLMCLVEHNELRRRPEYVFTTNILLMHWIWIHFGVTD